MNKIKFARMLGFAGTVAGAISALVLGDYASGVGLFGAVFTGLVGPSAGSK